MKTRAKHQEVGSRSARVGFGARCAFTLIEILVVISLFVLLLAVGIPAFASLMRSSERSLANNSMATAIRAARDIAQRSEGGDGALVFTMEPGGRLTMVPCVQVGEVLDRTGPLAGGQPIRRDVFVPHPLFKSSQLPLGWTVRGFASAGTIDSEWYGDNRPTNAYAVDPNNDMQTTNTDPQWLLPETGYYKGNQYAAAGGPDPDQTLDNGGNRQSFMLRFASGTGEMTASPTGAIVVLPIQADPAKEPAARAVSITTLNGPRNYLRARDASDLRQWATQILHDAAFDADATTRVKRLSLLGDESVDTVLCKTVPWVSMMSERQLAVDMAKGKVGSGAFVGKTLSVSLDRRTGTLYQAGEEPTMVGGNSKDVAGVVNALVNGQMIGLTAGSDGKSPPIVPEAQVFLVSAYQGNTLEVRQ